MIGEYRGLLREWVTIEPYRQIDGYTEVQYGDPIRIQAKIVGQTKVFYDTQGRQLVSMQRVILGSKLEVTTRDRITLIGRDPANPPILDVEKKFDEKGWHHTELHLGK